MKAQAYFDSNPMVRLFIPDDDEAVADLRLDDATPKAADESLHRLGLYRKKPWLEVEWGLEASVYRLKGARR